MKTEVCVVVIENDNKYLMVRRSGKGSYAGRWEYPGGKAEKNEEYEDAAVREVKEETGLLIKEPRYLGKYAWDRGGREATIIMFHCRTFDRKVKLSDEHDDYGWWSKEEILTSKNVSDDAFKFFEFLD